MRPHTPHDAIKKSIKRKIIIESFRHPARVSSELHKPIKMQELMKDVTRVAIPYLGHAREHARVFPKSINMLIRLLPQKLNARRRQGLKGILIQGHRD